MDTTIIRYAITAFILILLANEFWKLIKPIYTKWAKENKEKEDYMKKKAVQGYDKFMAMFKKKPKPKPVEKEWVDLEDLQIK